MPAPCKLGLWRQITVQRIAFSFVMLIIIVIDRPHVTRKPFVPTCTAYKHIYRYMKLWTRNSSVLAMLCTVHATIITTLIKPWSFTFCRKDHSSQASSWFSHLFHLLICQGPETNRGLHLKLQYNCAYYGAKLHNKVTQFSIALFTGEKLTCHQQHQTPWPSVPTLWVMPTSFFV